VRTGCTSGAKVGEHYGVLPSLSRQGNDAMTAPRRSVMAATASADRRCHHLVRSEAPTRTKLGTGSHRDHNHVCSRSSQQGVRRGTPRQRRSRTAGRAGGRSDRRRRDLPRTVRLRPGDRSHQSTTSCRPKPRGHWLHLKLGERRSSWGLARGRTANRPWGAKLRGRLACSNDARVSDGVEVVLSAGNVGLLEVEGRLQCSTAPSPLPSTSSRR
jgi:hypothetical protein